MKSYQFGPAEWNGQRGGLHIEFFMFKSKQIVEADNSGIHTNSLFLHFTDKGTGTMEHQLQLGRREHLLISLYKNTQQMEVSPGPQFNKLFHLCSKRFKQ